MSGDSKSSSSSAQTTNNTDNRAVADNGATVVTGSSGNSITMTDLGAIQDAFTFATSASHDMNKTYLDVSNQVFSSIKDSEQKVADAYANANGASKAAQYLGYAALAAMVATFYYTRKH